MTSLLSLLYFFAVFSTFVSEELPEIRKSCSYRTILIESTNYTRKHVDWPIPKDKWKIFEEEMKKKQYSNTRTKRMLKTTKPIDPPFRGYFRDDDDKMLEKDDVFRDAMRSLLLHNQVQRSLSNEFIKLLNVQNHPEPHIRLGSSVSNIQVFKNGPNRTIRVTVHLMLPDELLIWKCDDKGILKNGIYEFINLTPSWMVKDDNGETLSINLPMCDENQFNETFCPPNVKTFVNETCSVNNLNNCSVVHTPPIGIPYSFSRELQDGVAVYGSFENFSKMGRSKNGTKKSSPHVFNVIKPGLYFFGHKNSTIIKSTN